MIVTSHQIKESQTCFRRMVLESRWRYLKWHPNVLFAAVMRSAIFALSKGEDKLAVTQSAVNRFTTACRQPGLDLPRGIHPYTLAMDYCACIRTVTEYISRLALLTLTPKPDHDLMDGIRYKYLSLQDGSGVLHRWEFVDSISNDSVLKRLHSWEVVGDICMAHLPMNLHLVHIGRREGDHRSSPWCKAYQSPAINHYRFQKKDGTKLEGGWKPIYFADDVSLDSSVWVDTMIGDNCLSGLVRHVDVREPDDIHVKNCVQDVLYECGQIRSRLRLLDPPNPFIFPMSRGACDSPYICPHQTVCYSTNPMQTVQTSAMYEQIDRAQQSDHH